MRFSYKCKICGKVLTGEDDSKVYVLLGGKGVVFCEQCESQTDEATLALSDLKAMVAPWGMVLNGIDVPYADVAEPDFDIAMPDVIPDWSE